MAAEKRLIDSNEAFEMIIEFAGQAETKSAYAAVWKAGKAIQKMPAVDAVEVVHGRWKGAGMGDYFCSLCSEVVSGNEHNFCPNCGAKMDK